MSLRWWLSVVIMALALDLLMHEARSATYDPIVSYIEAQFGVRPGDPLPQDWRTPNLRFQYKGATSVGNGCYQVNVCRYR
jgi:hypothetical protein